MKLSFAPLEGITGWVYRSAHHDLFAGVDRYYAPFSAPTVDCPLSGRGLTDVLPEHNTGIPLVPQLLTNQSAAFLPAARMLADMGYEEVNLNLGCPSGTVTSKKKGSGFLALPEALDRFFDEVFSADLPIKVSVKTRVGVEDDDQWPLLLDIYNRYPICELTVHPRVRKDFYKGGLRMDTFAHAAAHCKLPLCYNGDLSTVADCKKILSEYPNVDHLMAGRGLIANPALARELSGGPPLNKAELERFHDRLLHDYQPTLSGDHPLLGKMKELWFYMGTLFDGAEKPLKAIKKAKTVDSYRQAAQALFRDCDLVSGSGFRAH